jgi:hypothetical protein
MFLCEGNTKKRLVVIASFREWCEPDIIGATKGISGLKFLNSENYFLKMNIFLINESKLAYE